MHRLALKEHIERRFEQRRHDWAKYSFDDASSACEITCSRHGMPELCEWLFHEWNFSYAGLIVEEGAQEWQLRHIFYGDRDACWVHVIAGSPLEVRKFPSIVETVHAADWHEREAEDLYGLVFEGHPRLGDFILHDDAWQENVEPMRRRFDPRSAMRHRKPASDWRPRRIVKEPGAFVMPVGPKYSGVTESVHFLLETVGEDVIRCTPRLFYKWRATEKLAEGKKADEVLLLAERFAATTAFAHGLAFCQSVERICGSDIPLRARMLRVFLAELERLRQHTGAIQEICESTALAVAASQAGILEEDLLRISCELTGNRYLFGMLAPGGLLCDLPDFACRKALDQSGKVLAQLEDLEKRLRVSSSFLDRLEEVGIVSRQTATDYALLGPIARASGVVRDLRRAQPYSGYEQFQFDVPAEQEGDGYARLRILFAEARQSVRIMEQAVAALQSGAVHEAIQRRAGAALGWVEAPRGGTFHWVRLDERGRVARYHVIPPSFANWHGFHLAVEKFAFQDFPIMLSTFDLSVAENDR
jgi:formate hydrogenlyase subunit 5